MAKTFRYQHLRTATSGAEPTPSVIREGELAVNIAKDGEKIFLKNNHEEIVKFITEAQIDAKIQSQSGTTDGKIQALSGAIDTLDDKVDGVSGAASTAIGAEETRAIGVETGLRTDVETVSGNVASEESRAKGIETGLRTDVNTVSGAVGAEETRAKGIEAELRTDVNAVSGNLATEISNRIAQDKAIVDSFVYDKNAKTITLSDGTNTSTISTDDFVKDGMIDSVTTQTSGATTVLVITWNTDAGSQQTIIDIGDLFEADNYYTKTEINAYSSDTKSDIDAKLAINDFNSYSSTTKDAIDLKAAQSDLTTLSGTVTAHTTDTDVHVTTSDKSTWSAKQDALVSGTNIKTVAGKNVLGSGNVEIGIADIKTNDVADFDISGDTIILDAGIFTEFIQ